MTLPTSTGGNCGACYFCGKGEPERCIFPIKRKKIADITATAVSSTMKAHKHALKDNWKNKGKYTYEKCANSHPPLKIADWFTVHGGAAESPLRKDLDIYVSLDSSFPRLGADYPWEENYRQPIIIPFGIVDMQAPSNPDQFKKMITWLVAQAKAGKQIHVGCMGGHGRTGTVLAALVKEATGEEDAISFVRKHYCQKAVESTAQVDFLHKHYGIKKQKGHKTWSPTSSTGWSSKKTYASDFNDKYARSSPDIAYPVKPLSYRGNVWGIEVPAKGDK